MPVALASVIRYSAVAVCKQAAQLSQTNRAMIYTLYQLEISFRNHTMFTLFSHVTRCLYIHLLLSGGATPGRARSNDLAGRSTALAQALVPPCLVLRFFFASVIVWTEN